MSSPVPNEFTTYNLSKEEFLQGSILNPLQTQVIQNELARVAQQILSLTYEPRNPVKFAQDDAALKGQLAVFRWLLDTSMESQNQLRALAVQSSGS